MDANGKVNVFRKEMATILFIIGVFDASFIVRFFFDLLIFKPAILDDYNCYDSEGNVRLCESYKLSLLTVS